jgi:hypothetical protein
MRFGALMYTGGLVRRSSRARSLTEFGTSSGRGRQAMERCPLCGFLKGTLMIKRIFGRIAIIIAFLLLIFIMIFMGNGFGWRAEIEYSVGITILDKNIAKWEGLSIDHYRVLVQMHGYCGDDCKTMPWMIEVKHDAVVSVTYNNGQIFTNTSGRDDIMNAAKRFTINRLFQEIRSTYNCKPPAITVAYNQEYGYPEKISINPYREPCCQAYGITVLYFCTL